MSLLKFGALYSRSMLLLSGLISMRSLVALAMRGVLWILLTLWSSRACVSAAPLMPARVMRSSATAATVVACLLVGWLCRSC